MSTAVDQTIPDSRLGPGTRAGSYLVERTLGAGGMGTVFAAKHIGLDKPVVLKALHPTLSAREDSVVRFIREGRAASKIRHPHVVDVTDVGTHDGVPFLVMEYLDGEDLEVRLRESGPLTPTEIARIMLPVLDAVASAHEQGVVHRDLKPSNIFLARGTHGREIPKVLDFGIAKILDGDEVNKKTITRAAMFLGTPYYSSPEQAQGGKNADAKSDQYSLGAILFELATGQRAVSGTTPFEVLTAIVARQATPIRVARPGVDPTLASIVERAMAYDRAERFDSVRDLGATLLSLADPATRAQWEPAFAGGARAWTVPEASSARVIAQPMPVAEPSAPRPKVDGFAETVGSASMSAPGVRSEPVAPARGRAGLLVGAALAGLLVAGAGVGAAWYLTRSPAPSAPLPEAPLPEIVVPAPARFELSVSPTSAEIALDGQAIGAQGHATLELARDGSSHLLRVSATDHEPIERTISVDAPPPARIALEPIAIEEPAAPEPANAVPEPSPAEPSPAEPSSREPSSSTRSRATPPVATPQPRPLGGAASPVGTPQPRPFGGGSPSPGGSTWGGSPTPRPAPAVGTNHAPIID